MAEIAKFCPKIKILKICGLHIIVSGFKSRAGYNGAFEAKSLLQGKMKLWIISGQYEAKVATV